ncbi:MAG: hypothetical protein ACK5IH_15735 [Betaproteobacteria bacterium]
MGAADVIEPPLLQHAGDDELALWQLRSTLALMRAALRGGATLDELMARHPVLHDTLDAAAARGLAELTLDDALARLAQRLEAGAPVQQGMQALAQRGREDERVQGRQLVQRAVAPTAARRRQPAGQRPQRARHHQRARLLFPGAGIAQRRSGQRRAGGAEGPRESGARGATVLSVQFVDQPGQARLVVGERRDDEAAQAVDIQPERRAQALQWRRRAGF